MAQYARASLLPFLLVTAIVGGITRTAAAKSYSADRFEVSARLLPDRSLRIEERIVFRFEGDYTYVFREIPQDSTDGVRDVEADMDGVRFPTGIGPGALEVRAGRAVRITWHFAPATGTHVFTLRYRLAGVVTTAGTEDVLAWLALPSDHRYRIAQASAVVALPPGARLASPPSLRPDATLHVDYAPGGLVAERIVASMRDLRPDDTIRLDLRLARGALANDPPAWQRERAERARRGPYLLIVAASILVLAFGWLAAFRGAWRRPDDAGRDAPSHAGPPNPLLPVAIAARLAGRRIAQGPHFVATMIDLASRGIIAIEEAPGGSRWRGRRFVARLAHEASGLRPHERAWLDVAFGPGRPRETEVPLTTLQHRFARRRNAFGRAVQDEMRHGGLVDPERVSARQSLVRAALAALALAVAAVAVALMLARTFGVWAAVIPAAFAVAAVSFGSAAVTFSTLTREGERVARLWRRYFADVRRLAKDKHAEAVIPADWLPYAVAAAVGTAWVRRLAAAPGGYVPPSWFQAATTSEDQGAVFVAFVGSHASSADAGAGGGGGSAGAAGGGASGAG